MECAYTFSGLVVGFIVGLTGVGAGALMTPGLHRNTDGIGTDT